MADAEKGSARSAGRKTAPSTVDRHAVNELIQPREQTAQNIGVSQPVIPPAGAARA